MEQFLTFWDQWHTPIRIVLILLGTVIVRWIALILVKRVIRGIEDGTRNHKTAKSDSPIAKARVVQRAKTMGSVLGNLITWTLLLFAVGSVLSELGIAVGALIASAGIVGAAIGFGAQSLVKDYFTGFVMLIENQIRQGDIVEVGSKSGTVEEVTLRYVRLRDYEGAVHYIPNSYINLVTNKSRTFAYAVVDIGVSYKENLNHVYSTIKFASQKLRQDPQYSHMILEDIEVAGVDQLGDFAVMIKSRMKVVAQDQNTVRRALLGEIKIAFDAAGIEIPSPEYKNQR